MKKLLLTIALLISALIATAQIDTTGMSDYEKYYYIKNGDIDTTKKVEAKNVEMDDLYYQPSKDQKHVTTIFNKKPRQPKSEEYYQGYNEGYEEGVEDVARLFDDDFSYANRFYRFNYGFGFSYYSPYWRFQYGYYDPFWYDPFYSPFRWDPWYYDRYYYSPYYSYNYWYSPYRYDYWYGYNYYPYTYNYVYINNRTPNRGYGALGSRYYTYQSPNKNIATSRSIYQKYPTTSAKSSISTMNDRRTSPSTYSKGVVTQSRTNVQTKQVPNRNVQAQTQTRRESPNEKPMYNSTQRSYTPSYSSPRMSTKPQYNNTQTRSYNYQSTQQNKSYSAPTQSRTTTQNRTYTSPSKSYSTPSKSTYSTPSRSSSSSSYSAPSTPPRTGTMQKGGRK